jgi:hypothetical protein
MYFIQQKRMEDGKHSHVGGKLNRQSMECPVPHNQILGLHPTLR